MITDDIDVPDSDAADRIRALLDARVAGIAARSIDDVVATLAPDVESYNVLPPHRLTGRDAVAKTLRTWFDGYSSPIGYEVHDLHVHAAGDVGWIAYLYRVTGTLTTGDDVDMWVRATLGCERRDGTWLVTHDHESVPWDPQTGQGVLNLASR